MATYKQLERDPSSRHLFNNRITTIQGLQNALQDSEFLAIDTEHVAITSEKDRILHQVGLAHLQTLQNSARTNTISVSTSYSHLQDFYTTNQIKALTLNINISKEESANFNRLRGGRDMPSRRSHRFGQELPVDFENVEAAILHFPQTCSNKKEKRLVLIGFEMAAEWTYLSSIFPKAMPFFSAWMDLRDIAKDITASVGVIPGLASLLQLFGYHWRDVQPGRGDFSSGIADNAGDDAIATCALASALLMSENQQKLRFRQECGRIARIFSKKKGCQVNSIRDPFTASIRVKGPLPSMINSGMKIARQFFNYSPQFTGILSNEEAFVTFKNQDQMNRFITTVHGQALPTGDVLRVERYMCENGEAEKEHEERKKKQDERKKKKLERTGDETRDLESLFSQVQCHKGLYD